MGANKKIVLICFAIAIVFEQTLSEQQSTLSETTFQRSCTGDADCFFHKPETRDQVFLACKEGKCQCQNTQLPPLDAANFRVRIVGEQCIVESSAPCGTSNGLTLVCDSGKDCVEGRCRSKEQIRSRKLKQSCHEDIDCQEGLKCKVSLTTFLPTSYCENP